MIILQNSQGSVNISQQYFSKLIGSAVSSCYGVSDMVPRPTQWIKSLLLCNRKLHDNGVVVRSINNRLVVSLHIAVMYGLNINAICESIRHKVSYVVEQATGLKVGRVIISVEYLTGE